MIIKKFLAKSEKDAIEMAKNELGNNAIVMNIKKVKPKGLAKLFVRGKVEVTAALDETPLYSQEEAAKEKRPVKQASFRKQRKKQMHRITVVWKNALVCCKLFWRNR